MAKGWEPTKGKKPAVLTKQVLKKAIQNIKSAKAIENARRRNNEHK